MHTRRIRAQLPLLCLAVAAGCSTRPAADRGIGVVHSSINVSGGVTATDFTATSSLPYQYRCSDGQDHCAGMPMIDCYPPMGVPEAWLCESFKHDISQWKKPDGSLRCNTHNESDPAAPEFDPACCGNEEDASAEFFQWLVDYGPLMQQGGTPPGTRSSDLVQVSSQQAYPAAYTNCYLPAHCPTPAGFCSVTGAYEANLPEDVIDYRDDPNRGGAVGPVWNGPYTSPGDTTAGEKRVHGFPHFLVTNTKGTPGWGSTFGGVLGVAFTWITQRVFNWVVEAVLNVVVPGLGVTVHGILNRILGSSVGTIVFGNLCPGGNCTHKLASTIGDHLFSYAIRQDQAPVCTNSGLMNMTERDILNFFQQLGPTATGDAPCAPRDVEYSLLPMPFKGRCKFGISGFGSGIAVIRLGPGSALCNKSLVKRGQYDPNETNPQMPYGPLAAMDGIAGHALPVLDINAPQIPGLGDPAYPRMCNTIDLLAVAANNAYLDLFVKSFYEILLEPDKPHANGTPGPTYGCDFRVRDGFFNTGLFGTGIGAMLSGADASGTGGDCTEIPFYHELIKHGFGWYHATVQPGYYGIFQISPITVNHGVPLFGHMTTDAYCYYGNDGVFQDVPFQGAGSPTGTLTATPQTCGITPQNPNCSSTLAWNVRNATYASLWIKNADGSLFSDGTTYKLVAGGLSGSLLLPWINATGFIFELHKGVSTSDTLLAPPITVQGAFICNENGLCEPTLGEDATNCYADCGGAPTTMATACGDSACSAGENSTTCPADCCDVNGQVQTQACNVTSAGTQSRTCIAGAWTPFTSCALPAAAINPDPNNPNPNVPPGDDTGTVAGPPAHGHAWGLDPACDAPTQAGYSCALTVGAATYQTGDTMPWTITSSASGLTAYWFGTKDGIPDANGLNQGAAPVNGSYQFMPTDSALYTRCAQLRDSAGQVLCTTNTVTVTVTPRVPTATCSLSFDQATYQVGDTPNPTITSSVSGLSAFWYGSGIDPAGNGVPAAYPNSETYQLTSADVGTHLRYAVLRDGGGNIACTTNSVTATVNPPPGTTLSCAIVLPNDSGGAPKTTWTVGETENVSIASTPAGLKAVWFGSSIQASGLRAGNTPYTLNYLLQPQDVATYTLYARLFNGDNEPVCTTNTVTIVVQPLPVGSTAPPPENGAACGSPGTAGVACTCLTQSGAWTSCLSGSNCTQCLDFWGAAIACPSTCTQYANGQNCTAGTQCTSGICASDGHCCGAACGSCGSCSTGSCVNLASGATGNPSCSPYVCSGSANACPTSCASNSSCAAADYCDASACVAKNPNGHICTAADQCTSGYCSSDGYCCGTSCGGCGTCSTGSCANRAFGFAGSPSCTPYVCSGSTNVCPSSCTTNSDCAAADYCVTGGNDAYTMMLLHWDFGGGGAVLDSSSHQQQLTGNVQTTLDTGGPSKFGAASANFTVRSEHVVSCLCNQFQPQCCFASPADWNFGTGDFTIDTWVYLNSLSFSNHYMTFASQGNSDGGVNQMRFSLHDTNGLTFNVVSGNNTIVSLSQTNLNGWSANAWYHVAVVRYGNTWTVYRDGVALASQTTPATYPVYTGSFYVGDDLSNSPRTIYGYMDEFRVSKGIARWTSSFAPPSIAYSNNGGSCAAKVGAGSACTANDQCLSGICAGNCCNSACASGGACGGSCNASGACVYPSTSTVCSSQSCSGSTQTNTAYCNGAGACNTPTTTNCAPFACGASACKTSPCTSNSDCISGDACIHSGQCVVPASGTAVSAGLRSTCAVTPSGGVQCWGYNGVAGAPGLAPDGGGELGNGTYASSAVAVNVSGIPTAGGATAIAVAAGTYHTCALLSNGQVMCWGENTWGELGNGTTTRSNTPVTVSGITTATAIDCGDDHTCALLSGGTVKCWGNNQFGQLGDNSTTNRSTPSAAFHLTTATQLSLGSFHSCARLSNQTVQCWGDNTYGQLGNGSTTQKKVPTNVSNISTASSVGLGGRHSCAKLSNGTIQCWGSNQYGELGNGGANVEVPGAQSTIPVAVVGISTANTVSAGFGHTCALLQDQTAKCWGLNGGGALGVDYTFNNMHTPVVVTNLTGATSFSAGWYHNCVTLSSGLLQCFGHNEYSQLGNNTAANDANNYVPGWVASPAITTCPAWGTGCSGSSCCLGLVCDASLHYCN
jgi:alpha-tubulin suppressor-like RCC1 family protein